MLSRLALLSGSGLGVVAGLAIGMGAYTFVWAKGYSYLTNDAAACTNCHVMGEQYSGWISGSHYGAAGCNDCHTPHATLGKYAAKAANGVRHSFYFTTLGFPEPIRLTDRNRRITEDACRRCHAEMVLAVDRFGHGRDEVACLSCHRSAGHLH